MFFLEFVGWRGVREANSKIFLELLSHFLESPAASPFREFRTSPSYVPSKCLSDGVDHPGLHCRHHRLHHQQEETAKKQP